MRVYRFGAEAFAAGVEEKLLDQVPVRIYVPEKALAAAFKFRNQIRMDIVQEALRSYRTRRRRDYDAVLRYARICCVERVMRPYLEAQV